MPDTSSISGVDRRKFLNGRWPATDKDLPTAAVEIASILVQTRPEHLEAVSRAIEALPGSKIHGRSPQGKLVVVIEAENISGIGGTLNTICSMPHVLTAALVFHATDNG